MISLASVNLPVTRRRPRNEMKVSLPQDLMYPVEKCGRPAAMVGAEAGGERSEASGGSGADGHFATCMMDPWANSLTRSDPPLTRGDISV